VIVFAVGIIIICKLRRVHERIVYNSRMYVEDSSFLVHEFQVFPILKNVFVVFGVWKKVLRKVLIIGDDDTSLQWHFQPPTNCRFKHS
jgi:hypothetical protein